MDSDITVEERQKIRRRRVRNYQAALIAGGVVGAVIYGGLSLPPDFFSQPIATPLPWYFSLPLAAGAAGLVALFFISFDRVFQLLLLSRSESSQYSSNSSASELRLSSSDVNALVEGVSTGLRDRIEGTGPVFSSDERTEMATRIVAGASIDLGPDVTKLLHQTVAATTANAFEQNSLKRLSDHIEVLGQRANFSLQMGLGFAAGGVIVLLLFVVFDPTRDLQDIVPAMYHYLPRLSIVVIVELVAFFFLRTFARILSDIRYVQNEVTNVEMKLVALHTSISRNLKSVTEAALLALVNTERNHILEKGQRSLENERERIESKSMTETLAALAQMIRGKGDPPPAHQE